MSMSWIWFLFFVSFVLCTLCRISQQQHAICHIFFLNFHSTWWIRRIFDGSALCIMSFLSLNTHINSAAAQNQRFIKIEAEKRKSCDWWNPNRRSTSVATVVSHTLSPASNGFCVARERTRRGQYILWREQLIFDILTFIGNLFQFDAFIVRINSVLSTFIVEHRYPHQQADTNTSQGNENSMPSTITHIHHGWVCVCVFVCRSDAVAAGVIILAWIIQKTDK